MTAISPNDKRRNTAWLKTVGDRAIPVAASSFWNEPPGDVTAAESLTTFRRRLKTILFRRSFPGFS